MTTVPPVTSTLVESGAGEYPHEIRVLNEIKRQATLTVIVERNDELLYRKTHTAPGSEEQVIAGITRTSLPKDRRELRISVTFAERTGSISIQITDCLGDLLISIPSSNDFELTYAIC